MNGLAPEFAETRAEFSSLIAPEPIGMYTSQENDLVENFAIADREQCDCSEMIGTPDVGDGESPVSSLAGTIRDAL